MFLNKMLKNLHLSDKLYLNYINDIHDFYYRMEVFGLLFNAYIDGMYFSNTFDADSIQSVNHICICKI